MGVVSGIGSIKGHLSPIGSLSGTLSVCGEIATDEDIDILIKDVFGIETKPDEPLYDENDIATNNKFEDTIINVSG